MNEIESSFTYTYEDFFESTDPFEEVYRHRGDPFTHDRLLEKMTAYAKQLGVGNFKKLYGSYTQSLQLAAQNIYINNATDFSGQPLALSAGDWRADDYGIIRRKMGVEEEACCHPILPVERLVNIDTGIEKLKIAFSKGRRWREIVVNKGTLANARNIITLADAGIAVNSNNAGLLVQFLHDMEKLNYDIIPEVRSVGRVGWIDDEGFAPYVDDLTFDGMADFKDIFESISAKGRYKEWLKIAIECRDMSITAKIVLASSFASALVKVIGALPYFVHLWGGSGSGKTVALMLASSVWADPERYMRNFNLTYIGSEEICGFLNSLPLCLDDLQLAKDSRGNIQFNVYRLAQGKGRTKSKKEGGLARTPTWMNSILTTGESPLVSLSDGAGALNRVLDIECSSDENDKVIYDGLRVSNTVRKHYGFAGRIFVEHLENEQNIERVQALYQEYFRKLSASDTTEKQAAAAAMICTADELATEWIFQDGKPITVEEISQFLQSKASVSAGERGYAFMCDWVAGNANRLQNDVEQGEVYGVIENEWVYIIKSVFNKVASAEGYSPQALLSWMKEKGLILTRGRNLSRGKRINGVNTDCVCMKLPPENPEELKDLEDLPF